MNEKEKQAIITDIVGKINIEFDEDDAYNQIWNAALDAAIEAAYMREGRVSIQDFELENLKIEL